MSQTQNVDQNRVLRVTDDETLQAFKASGEIDRDKTDYLEITGNSAASGSAVVKIEAKNDNETNVDVQINPKAAGTLTIGGTGGTTIEAGGLTVTAGGLTVSAGGLSVVGAAGGTVATATGLTGAESGAGPVYQTTLTMASLTMDVIDSAGQGGHGSQLLYTFPGGHIKILGTVADFTATFGGTVAADSTYDIGIGTTATAVDNPELATTEQNILAKQEGDLTADVATVAAGTGTDVTIDGTTTAVPAYLNIAIVDVDMDGDDTADIDGTITFTWVNLGDYA